MRTRSANDPPHDAALLFANAPIGADGNFRLIDAGSASWCAQAPPARSGTARTPRLKLGQVLEKEYTPKMEVALVGPTPPTAAAAVGGEAGCSFDPIVRPPAAWLPPPLQHPPPLPPPPPAAAMPACPSRAATDDVACALRAPTLEMAQACEYAYVVEKAWHKADGWEEVPTDPQDPIRLGCHLTFRVSARGVDPLCGSARDRAFLFSRHFCPALKSACWPCPRKSFGQHG